MRGRLISRRSGRVSTLLRNAVFGRRRISAYVPGDIGGETGGGGTGGGDTGGGGGGTVDPPVDPPVIPTIPALSRAIRIALFDDFNTGSITTFAAALRNGD